VPKDVTPGKPAALIAAPPPEVALSARFPVVQLVNGFAERDTSDEFNPATQLR
jgi:hypothetical protein